MRVMLVPEAFPVGKRKPWTLSPLASFSELLLKRSSWRAALIVLCLCLWPHAVQGQAFLASRPNPEVMIGSLFVHASVLDVDRVTVDVFFRILHGATDMPQDLYLLWPSEVIRDPRAGRPDPSLDRFVESLGMTVIDAGRLPLASTVPPNYEREPNPSGASFVTVVTREPSGLSPPATLIKIPWSPRNILVLTMRMKSVIQPRTASWLEGLYSGWRYTAALSFHDLRFMALRPFYVGREAHIVQLANEDFHRLQITFAHADRLRIEAISPAAALSRLNEEKDNTQTISLFLDKSSNPTALQVQFIYSEFLQTVLVTVVLFLFAQLISPWLIFVTKGVWRFLRPGIHVKLARTTRERQAGVLLAPEHMDQIAVGESTYENILRLCGPPSEDQAHSATPDQRTILYRGRRWVPRWVGGFGLLTAATGWDVEDHDVEISFERGRVVDVQTRVRRSRYLP